MALSDTIKAAFGLDPVSPDLIAKNDRARADLLAAKQRYMANPTAENKAAYAKALADLQALDASISSEANAAVEYATRQSDFQAKISEIAGNIGSALKGGGLTVIAVTGVVIYFTLSSKK